MFNTKKWFFYLSLLLLTGCDEKTPTVITQDEMSIYLEAQQTDPEGFGQRILDAEVALAQAEKTCHEKDHELKRLLTVVGLGSP